LIEKTSPSKTFPADFLGIETKTLTNWPPLSLRAASCRAAMKFGERRITRHHSDYRHFELVDGYFHQFGKITEENVRGYISQERQEFVQDDSSDGIIIYGTKGSPIKAKTVNHRSWCNP